MTAWRRGIVIFGSLASIPNATHNGGGTEGTDAARRRQERGVAVAKFDPRSLMEMAVEAMRCSVPESRTDGKVSPWSEWCSGDPTARWTRRVAVS